MLIRRAELENGTVADLRIVDGFIAAIGNLPPCEGEPVLDAAGGRLIPGLHDHHIHLAAFSASLASVACGPPQVADVNGLAATLRRPGGGWLRGIGYHESVAGYLDATALDRLSPDRPLRIQHRSGRMWFFNSAGLDALLAAGPPPPGLERNGGHFTGRLFDEDAWLKRTLGGTPPCFAEASARLAHMGITGVTEISPANDRLMARHFSEERRSGALRQTVLLGGGLGLDRRDMAPGITLGPAKMHLHEATLPPLDDLAAFVTIARAQNRPVAVHCATQAELLYTLALFDITGTRPGDRIEHGSIAPDHAVERMARFGLAVVSQPHFIAERGDAYRRDVDPEEQPWLYRLRGFLAAGVPLAAGSDAPCGGIDPWASMAAAVSRRSAEGHLFGPEEALTPEQALDLYLRAPEALDQRRHITVGAPADLCLLNKPWAQAREALSSDLVRAVFRAGQRIDDRVDQPPVQRRAGADAPA